jgi:hypothetical protein
MTTLDDPVARLDMAGYGDGILASGPIGYAFGNSGLIVLDGLGTANVSLAANAFSTLDTVNLIQHEDTLVAVGPGHVTLFGLSNPSLPVELNSHALGGGNTGFSAAVVRDDTLLVGQFASGVGGTTGIAVFDYSHPNLTPITTMGDIPEPYHLRTFGSQVVACNSGTITLWDFTFSDDAVMRDVYQVGGRACARDGDRIIANGVVLNYHTDSFTFVNGFVHEYVQIDGWPHGSDVEGAFVFLTQSPRVLLLTRPTPLVATNATTPPVIDGAIRIGEWSLEETIPFDHGFIAARNDGERLYLLVDVLDDYIEEAADDINISFDVNGDGQVTPFVDINYHLTDQTRNLRPRYYASEQSFGSDFTVYRSSRAKGYNCSIADGSIYILPQEGLICDRHVVWELAIDLREIGAEPGDTLRMGIGVGSGSPQFYDELPAGYLYQFANLLQIELADVFPFPPPDTAPAVPFQANPLEVTQAVQTPSSTLPLVADKDTTVRAYLNNTSGSPANLTVYLYGSRGGVDLPGSPLTTGIAAPTAVDRNRLAHTANFDLPADWVDAGTVQLYARSRRWLGASSTSSTVSVNFQTRDVPIVWTIPVNQGTASSPSLQSAGDMADAREYMETVYPVPDITYVNRDWTVLGANMPNSDALIDELNEYHGTALLAWILGFLFTGESPFDLPDQVHGFTPTSDGLSDPTWYNNGNGYVSYSGDISDGDLIMAHEINHNLDRSDNGTWGRHNGGCGSTGPDPNWPYGNDDVNEIGFDTRPPWVDGVVSDRRTVITDSYPDFMSYCTHANMPGAWISPYRWSNLFTALAPPSREPGGEPLEDGLNPATRRMLAAAGGIQEVLYLSGRLGVGGDGELDPILVEQGLPMAEPSGSQYTIELRGVGGALVDSLSFDMVFEDVEGNPLTDVYFSFQVPSPGSVTAVRLKEGGTLLYEIVVSLNAPTVTIQEPNGGEVWTGTGVIDWTASDTDGDELSFTLLYSPDNGATWHPIASDVTGDSFVVNAALLPGGNLGKVRILATDGYNTTSADSSGTFTVPNQPPLASIDSPLAGAYLPAGEVIRLQASAQDPEGDTLSAQDFVWKIDGDIVAIGEDAEIYLAIGRYTIVLEVSDHLDNVTTLSSPINIGLSDVFMPVLINQ